MANRALQELNRRAKLEGWTSVDVGKRLKISQPTASRLLRGERGPSLGLGNRIQSELGIPVAWWGEPEKKTDPAPTDAVHHVQITDGDGNNVGKPIAKASA